MLYIIILNKYWAKAFSGGRKINGIPVASYIFYCYHRVASLRLSVTHVLMKQYWEMIFFSWFVRKFKWFFIILLISELSPWAVVKTYRVVTLTWSPKLHQQTRGSERCYCVLARSPVHCCGCKQQGWWQHIQWLLWSGSRLTNDPFPLQIRQSGTCTYNIIRESLVTYSSVENL